MSDINTGGEHWGNDWIERVENAAEKYGVECHGVPLNVGWFLDLLDAAVEKERADAIKEYKQSEEYIKECVQRYLKGRADIQSEIMDEVAMLNETKMTEGDLKCFAYRIKAIAEKKTCSNGQPCTHPNCKRCGTTHFMSECDYGKEQKNGKEE